MTMDSQNVYLGPPRPEPVALADRRAMFTADEQLLADLLRRDRSTPPDRLWRYVWDVLGRDQLPHLPPHLQLDHAAKRLIALGRLIDDLEAPDGAS